MKSLINISEIQGII